MTTISLVAIGLVAGVISGLFGVGGGLVIVPCLAFFVGLKIHAAVGTSLGALLLPVGLLGALQFYKGGNLNIKYALLLALGLFIGTYFGAKIVQSISPLTLRRLYAVFLLIVAGKMLLGK